MAEKHEQVAGIRRPACATRQFVDATDRPACDMGKFGIGRDHVASASAQAADGFMRSQATPKRRLALAKSGNERVEGRSARRSADRVRATLPDNSASH